MTRYEKFKFKGIKYSKAEIFFKFENETLYKYPVYKGAKKEWMLSDYYDYSGNSKKWINATREQIDRYRLKD